jgi:YD repeat-containing protein
VENELASVVVNGQTTSFTYDAAGIRVKTVKPNGVVIDHPFPTYEVENPTATTPIRRSIYTIAGQTVATRVSGDPVSGNNGISCFYNDHASTSLSTSLGSNTALRKPDGSRVATYYLPLRLRSVQAFGNYRGTAPNQTITDRDFTGQPQNRAVGLLYYQARFYVPGIGWIAQ